MKKLFGVLALSAACLISQFSAMANSAQKDWQGTSANGVIVTDEECPVTVEKERLTFDISELPVASSLEGAGADGAGAGGVFGATFELPPVQPAAAKINTTKKSETKTIPEI